MNLKIDTGITYALALEGGGAKGAYQIGVWRAMREAGLRIAAVSGTSVGALNGVLITMGDLKRAEEIWETIRYSKVIDVDDETMHKLIARDLKQLDLRELTGQLAGFLKNRGLDVSPLYNWMKEVVCEPQVRASDTELYIVTYSIDEQKELELRAKDLPEGTVVDMLLASAYLPVFRSEKLGGKRYTDGGIRDVLPLHVLLQNGYRDIIAIRLGGSGTQRRVRIPRSTSVYTIAPTQDLGNILDFNAEHSRELMKIGYFDAQRFLYGLSGERWYLDAEWTEDDAYAFLFSRLRAVLPRGVYSRRQLNEKAIPMLAKKLDAPQKGYKELAYALLEAMAEQAGLERYRIYTEEELLLQLDASFSSSDYLKKLLPKSLLSPSASLVKRSQPPARSDGLHICLTNDSFPPTIDGVANAVKNYADIITAKHGRCAVVTPQYPDVTDDYPYPVIRYPSLDTMKLAGYRAGKPLAPETMSKLSQMDFNLIHAHCPLSSAVLSCSLREMINAPVVLTYHTKFDIDINRAIKSELLQNAVIKLLVNNISACDDVWVVSAGAGENLRSLGFTGNYTIMPNGVDLPRGRVEDSALRALDAQWSLPTDTPVYLFIGRMMWYKNLRLILDALAQLAPQQRFTMVFVGDGQERKEVEEYAAQLGLSPHCRFVGAVQERETIRAWYCRANLLLFPSTFDTNGLVVREAAACGLGSVLVRGSCAAEGITDGRTGILIDETAQSLCAALRKISAPLARQIGETAEKEIYLSWDESVAAACEQYQIILDKWNRGELHRHKVPFDALFEISGDMLQTLAQAKQQRLAAFSQLTKEFNRVKEKLDRYL